VSCSDHSRPRPQPVAEVRRFLHRSRHCGPRRRGPPAGRGRLGQGPKRPEPAAAVGQVRVEQVARALVPGPLVGRRRLPTRAGSATRTGVSDFIAHSRRRRPGARRGRRKGSLLGASEFCFLEKRMCCLTPPLSPCLQGGLKLWLWRHRFPVFILSLVLELVVCSILLWYTDEILSDLPPYGLLFPAVSCARR
jgi:hypothetical protein